MIAPRIRQFILVGFAAVCLLLSIAPSFAQPAPVPALPDSERRTSYSITASTCGCSVGFALFGDGTDFANWVEVFVNGTRVNFNDATFGWTITSPSGPLSNLARPITNAVLTFTNAQTGTVQIVGARRPRRVSQYQENNGVPTRNFNRDLTDIIAQNRELWDKTNDITGRGLFFEPGNAVGPMPLPSACQNNVLGFDSTGLNPVCLGAAGNVSLPVTSGNLACFNGTTGLLQDCGKSPAFVTQAVNLLSAAPWNDVSSVVGDATTFFNPNGPAVVSRFNRLLVGEAALGGAGSPPTPKDWMETLLTGTTQNGQISAVSTLGLLGIVGGSRTSDWRTASGTASGGSQGVTGIAYNDDPGTGSPIACGVCAIAIAKSTVTSGITINQFDVDNAGPPRARQLSSARELFLSPTR